MVLNVRTSDDEVVVNLQRGSVLAVSSGGGHWDELMLLRDGFEDQRIFYVTTSNEIADFYGIDLFSTIPDCNQNQPIKSILCFISALWIVARLRPKVVLSTGAAPGFFCILAGRLFGSRTLWIDSIANGEELSMCGRLSQAVAHECWTQWPHLAGTNGPRFRGSVL